MFSCKLMARLAALDPWTMELTAKELIISLFNMETTPLIDVSIYLSSLPLQSTPLNRRARWERTRNNIQLNVHPISDVELISLRTHKRWLDSGIMSRFYS